VFAASPEAVVVLRYHIAVGGAVHFELFDVFGLEGDLEVVKAWEEGVTEVLEHVFVQVAVL
jgi:hypothetical protein